MFLDYMLQEFLIAPAGRMHVFGLYAAEIFNCTSR